MNTVIDPELKAIHIAVHNLYNRETTFIQSNPTSAASVNATNFLARQAILFADAALYLMEDAKQPLIPAVALMRTCLEAQARANHIIAAAGDQREQRANEFLQLMKVGYDYYAAMVIQMMKDFASDPSKFLPRELKHLAVVKPLVEKTDTSNLYALKSQYRKVNNNWTYGKVIGRDVNGKDMLLDPAWQKRSEAQPNQPGHYLSYTLYCAFLHSDPAALKLEAFLSTVGEAYTAVLAEVTAVLCFFTALGKEKDQDFLNLKKRLIAFDVNEKKILPSKDLPRL